VQDSLDVARKIKEDFCYVCPDLAKEFAKYDKNPEKFFKQCSGSKVPFLSLCVFLLLTLL
jgi:actin-related protein 3